MEKIYVVKVSWFYESGSIDSEVRLGYRTRERAEEQARLIIEEELANVGDDEYEMEDDFTIMWESGDWFEARVAEVEIQD